MNFVKISILCVLLFSINSCTKDVDFDQIDEAAITPNLILTLVHFNLSAIDINDNLIFDGLIDLVRVPIGDGTEDSIEKINLTVVTDNSFDKQFRLTIIFFDESQLPIYTLPQQILIEPNTSEQEIIIEIPSEDIPKVFETEYFGFFLEIFSSDGGSEITPEDPGKLVLKSSIEIFFNFTE